MSRISKFLEPHRRTPEGVAFIDALTALIGLVEAAAELNSMRTPDGEEMSDDLAKIADKGFDVEMRKVLKRAFKAARALPRATD